MKKPLLLAVLVAALLPAVVHAQTGNVVDWPSCSSWARITKLFDHWWPYQDPYTGYFACNQRTQDYLDSVQPSRDNIQWYNGQWNYGTIIGDQHNNNPFTCFQVGSGPGQLKSLGDTNIVFAMDDGIVLDSGLQGYNGTSEWEFPYDSNLSCQLISRPFVYMGGTLFQRIPGVLDDPMTNLRTIIIDHGLFLTSYHGMTSITVTPQQEVSRGQLIGTAVGSAGAPGVCITATYPRYMSELWPFETYPFDPLGFDKDEIGNDPQPLPPDQDYHNAHGHVGQLPSERVITPMQLGSPPMCALSGGGGGTCAYQDTIVIDNEDDPPRFRAWGAAPKRETGDCEGVPECGGPWREFTPASYYDWGWCEVTDGGAAGKWADPEVASAELSAWQDTALIGLPSSPETMPPSGHVTLEESMWAEWKCLDCRPGTYDVQVYIPWTDPGGWDAYSLVSEEWYENWPAAQHRCTAAFGVSSVTDVLAQHYRVTGTLSKQDIIGGLVENNLSTILLSPDTNGEWVSIGRWLFRETPTVTLSNVAGWCSVAGDGRNPRACPQCDMRFINFEDLPSYEPFLIDGEEWMLGYFDAPVVIADAVRFIPVCDYEPTPIPDTVYDEIELPPATPTPSFSRNVPVHQPALPKATLLPLPTGYPTATPGGPTPTP